MSDTVMRCLNSSSNLGRRHLCPGSAFAEKDLPPDPESEFAAEGTLLHWKDANPEESRDELTESQCLTLERNKRLRDTYIQQLRIDLDLPPDAKVRQFVEQEYILCDENGFPWKNPINGEPFPGHPDLVVYFPEHGIAIIFDSKFGRDEVPAAELNMQLRSYVVMFAENFDCVEIHAAISQPWVAAPNNFHAVKYTADAIPDAKREILAILAETIKPDAKRIPSREACKFCRAKADCREALYVVTEIAETKISGMSLRELEGMGDNIASSKRVIKAWEDRMKYILAKAPELVENYELRDGAVMRQIPDAHAAFYALRSAGNILAEDFEEALQEFFSICDASPSQLIILAANNRGITEETARNFVTSALGDLIVSNQNSPSLKPVVKKLR